MSLSSDRNPSPPPEILDKDENLVPDRIGNTVYSKRWLYKTLMHMLKVVQKYSSSQNYPNAESPENLLTEDQNSSSQIMMELDPQIEEEACTLWDMSASQEVAEFLCECDVANVFLEIIDNTKSPRLLEIVIGILGNMSTYNSTCEYITNNKELVYAIVMLSGCSDSCTLVQLFRLLTCGIVRENCKQIWLSSFEANPSFMENLKCILENNLCRDVLKGLLEFLDSILNCNSNYCSIWGEHVYVLAITICGKQLLKCGHNEDLDIFFTVLNTICQESSNILVYGKNFEALRPIFHTYFTKLGEEEYLPQITRINAITSAFALYGNLLFNKSIPQEQIKFDIDVFNAMLNTCKMIRRLLVNLKGYKERALSCSLDMGDISSVTMTQERNGAASEDGDIEQNWSVLLEAIGHAAKACIPLSNEANELQVLNQLLSLQRPAEDVVL